MAHSFSKAEIIEAASTIYGHLSDGLSDKEAMAEMGLSSEEYEQLKAAMFDIKADEIRKRPVEHVYVEYIMQQSQNIKDLTGMIDDARASRQANALVGAVRARAEIYDKLIERGQTFGLIKKEPDRKVIVAGHLIANLNNLELKKLISKELSELNKVMKRYGDDSFEEIRGADSIYHGPGLPAHCGEDEDEYAGMPMTVDVTPEGKIERKFEKGASARVSKNSAGRKMKMPPPPIDIDA